MNGKICPLMKCECLENKCSWWISDCEDCVINSVSHHLDTMSFVAEKMESMVLDDD